MAATEGKTYPGRSPIVAVQGAMWITSMRVCSAVVIGQRSSEASSRIGGRTLSRAIAVARAAMLRRRDRVLGLAGCRSSTYTKASSCPRKTWLEQHSLGWTKARSSLSHPCPIRRSWMRSNMRAMCSRPTVPRETFGPFRIAVNLPDPTSTHRVGRRLTVSATRSTGETAPGAY